MNMYYYSICIIFIFIIYKNTFSICRNKYKYKHHRLYNFIKNLIHYFKIL